MDDVRGERLALLDDGEARVVAALLDELAALCGERDPVGELAREMAVRLNDRRGV